MQSDTSLQRPKLFSELTLQSVLKKTLADIGLEELTEIQSRSLPALLEGRDLVGQSKTGSGKTLAFSLPILERIRLPNRRPQALILCPTRELCAQVARELRKFGRSLPGLQVLVLAGGEPLRFQLQGLEAGAHILVGTPGRMMDHIRRETLDLVGLRFLVLDEADRMLDMGFAEDMEQILKATPQDKQTIFFSATFPESVEQLSQKYQRQALSVSVADFEPAAQTIEQQLVEVAADAKLAALHRLLDLYKPETAIVFANFKAAIADIQKALTTWGVSAGALHGDLEQFDRDRVMAKLRNKSLRVLVATDVAARGLDVADLDLVINYDLPLKPEVYVHRIGRTGRAGQSGLAVSLATPREAFKIEAIETYTGIKLEKKKLDLPAANKPAASAKALFQGAAMTTLSIGGGRKDKLRPGDILGALTGEAGGLRADEVGKIEILDRIAYVAVAQSVGRHAIECLREGRIKGRKFTVEWIKS